MVSHSVSGACIGSRVGSNDIPSPRMLRCSHTSPCRLSPNHPSSLAQTDSEVVSVASIHGFHHSEVAAFVVVQNFSLRRCARATR